MSSFKKKFIIHGIIKKIYENFYGKLWYDEIIEQTDLDLVFNRAIRNLSPNLNSKKIVENEMKFVFKEQLFSIIDDVEKFPEISFNFYKLCVERNITRDPLLIDFAYYLAFDPINIFSKFGSQISRLVHDLFQNKDLSRSAKILQLVYFRKNFDNYQNHISEPRGLNL